MVDNLVDDYWGFENTPHGGDILGRNGACRPDFTSCRQVGFRRRLVAMSESEIVLGVEFVSGLVVERGSGLVSQWLRRLVVGVQG